jgi:hypothetical protein
MNILVQVCGSLSLLLIILFIAGVIRGAIREQQRPPRKPSLGREIRLNAWNYRTAYTSGVCTNEFEDGLHVFYRTPREKEIAERNFPNAVIQEMTAEDLFHFEHPNR